MAGLIPFNRFNAMSPFASEFHSMLDDFFSDNWSPRRSLMNDTFKLDVKEDDNSYTIEADLPGVKKEEISLSLEENCLTLNISRREEEDSETQNYIHRERRFTSMQRSIYLAEADKDGICAKLNDGVLQIDIPKLVKTSASRQIEIQ